MLLEIETSFVPVPPWKCTSKKPLNIVTAFLIGTIRIRIKYCHKNVFQTNKKSDFGLFLLIYINSNTIMIKSLRTNSDSLCFFVKI